METQKTFIFFGMVGSGKGTQVSLLQKYIKEKNPEAFFVFASPGNGYRKLINDGYYTGSIVKESLDRGYLQPDFLTNALVISNLAFEIKEDSFLIADGYPRTINQSKTFEEIINYYGRTNINIFYIEVGKEEAMKRMKLRARTDDTNEGIAQRFDEYVNNVLPAMEYFKNKDDFTIHSINGEQSINQVHSDIVKILEK